MSNTEEIPYRRAVIAARTHNDHVSIPAYLPGSYKVVGTVEDFDDFGTTGLLIEGKDDHGWTLDGYVLPRLASGNHFGRELKDGELASWTGSGKFTPLEDEDGDDKAEIEAARQTQADEDRFFEQGARTTPAFEAITVLSYDAETDTLTEVL